MSKEIIKAPEQVSGDLIIDPPRTKCDCGWSLPVNLFAPGQVQYACPDCGERYLARPM